MDAKKIFISYSWDNEDHRLWVKKLADTIEENKNFHVLWDGYDLDSLVDKNLYMEESIRNSDYTLVIATENYKKKANERRGGVGIETYLGVNEHWKLLEGEGKTKFIPLLKDKGAIPTYLEGHFYIDFTKDNEFNQRIEELLSLLNGKNLFLRPKKKLEILKS